MRASLRLRQTTSYFLVAIGFALIVVGLIIAYVGHVVLDARAFADRFAQAIREPEVAATLAGEISQAAIRSDPDLIPYQALIFYGAKEIVASDIFSGIARRGAEGLHYIAISEGGRDLLLNLSDVGTVLEGALPVLPPEIAGRIPQSLTVRLSGDVDTTAGWARALRVARRLAEVMRFSIWIVLGGVLCLVLATIVSRSPWRIGSTTGWFLIGVAALMLVIRIGAPIAATIAFDQPVRGAAAAAVLRIFLDDMRDWVLIVGGIGIVTLSASRAITPTREDAIEWIEAHWRRLMAPPETNLEMFLRAAGFIAAGVILTRWPGTAIELVVTLGGAILTFIGLSALTTMFFRFRRVPARARVDEDIVDPESRQRAWAIGVIVTMSVIGAAMWLIAGPPTAALAAQPINRCNGMALLCDRTVDQVVFPTTHNSMGAADVPDWFFPNQDASIATQLDDGIRGFLIDVHYGYDIEGRILTEIDDEGAAREKYADVLGEEGLEAAFRIRARMVGKPRGERRLYLCHGFCEIGSLQLHDVFSTMAEFLREHPNEVLIIVIQDEEVDPADIAAAADESGLSEFIYRSRGGPPWPTLRRMIEASQQVIVMAENNPGDVPWYHKAFDVLQETPYDFRDPTAFECKPNRGGTLGSLMLLNHWITSVPASKPANAALVNAYDFLMRRVQQCMEEREMLPNLLAVDFYQTGDVLRVAQELNSRSAVLVQ